LSKKDDGKGKKKTKSEPKGSAKKASPGTKKPVRSTRSKKKVSYSDDDDEDD